MPELPEVETVAKGLEQALIGDSFSKITLRRKDLRFPFPENFTDIMSGKVITHVGRRAKYLLMTLEDSTVMIGHLGMSGSFRIDQNLDITPEKHDHMIFQTRKGITVRYHDPRRFGFMLLTTEAEMANHPRLKDIGPEPLGNAFNGPVLAKNLSSRKGPIKTAILDQKVVAGIGNIYACEALFRASISPTCIANRIKGKRAELLANTIKNVLSEAIEAGGSTSRNYSNTDGELGYFQHSFQVYGRENEPCPSKECNQTIARMVQSGRSTFFCSHCQK
ncbi:MAG: bifunctional DNA-formamidopyrimidine glycosylase/DNA-(apurinic or apyrimidinic site) lyase [Sneathiella sp.]|nr:bifunctional DNA-formamidopyrimidine glycosylase/DNA-(apurinic or apyrimidinic site) lyase [Sneathiella sp.]